MMPSAKKVVATGRRGGKTMAQEAAVAEAVADGVAVHSVSANPVPDEDWPVAQVASHMGLSYQTARNQMLSGVFGQSKYDASKRRLTVSANLVKRAKTLKTKTRPKSKGKTKEKRGRRTA